MIRYKNKGNTIVSRLSGVLRLMINRECNAINLASQVQMIFIIFQLIKNNLHNSVEGLQGALVNSSVRIIFILLIGIVTSGCSLLTGRPEAPVDVDRVAKGLERKINQKLESLDASNMDTDKERNASINDALTLIDFRYSEFINNAGLQQRAKSMATDFALLSLNLAGTAVGGAGIKTLLAALSAGVAGTNIAFDKTFIYESTVPALIMQMNADRTEKYRQIITGMRRDIDNYPWAQAVHDLIDYYNAGTLQNAINSIKKNAGNKQVKEEENIENFVMKAYKATPTDVIVKQSLTTSLNNMTDMNDTQLTQVKTILEPLSKALNHLSDCKTLSLQAEKTVPKDKVKEALQNCIRQAGEGGKPIAEDLEKLDTKFREIDLITNKASQTKMNEAKKK